ncbi:COBRA-like protein 10 [Magnolia sinica]|uniref:COBRA-like protein 10 n=1 Tax=Magnolia sinica TaxID=86752 RepID=UPI0026599749|nr:COBRA-like protein 10 [Magnolia sinica]
MVLRALLLTFFLVSYIVSKSHAQDYDEEKAAPPPALNNCNGVFLSYAFNSREKEFPFVKNATAQAYAFQASVMILNASPNDLKAWKIFIGFQYDEILVSADGAVLMDGEDFPARVGNGTYLSGYPQTDLKTSIETAADWNQIQATIDLKGTQFGLKPPRTPMPKTIRLANDGFKCPAPVRHKTEMHVCCVLNPKFKPNVTKPTKFLPRQDGDLLISYDVINSFGGNYMAQVLIDNKHPLGRLDNWNLTWEWMRGEFIYSMKGAYTHKISYADCLYGEAGKYYKDFDFTPVMNCEKKPIISDLPPDREKDDVVGNIPFCCRNGSLLPTSMDETKSKAAFQLIVYKIPPDMNRTALYAPQHWKINGVLNPAYKCGQPIRVNPTEFPDKTGLPAVTYAIASWQVVCNITRPKNKNARCCVSFSAFYNDTVVPCNTCACGCDDTSNCNPDAPALLLPSEALLVPFENRTAKAKAWAKIKHYPIPKRLPCADNCGVSINWHIFTDYRKGWTARMTLFNWDEYTFIDWFTAIQMRKGYYRGYENVYSFNGTKMPEINNTIFFQGLLGLNYLIGETNGTKPSVDPRVPGKQQSVISFTKRRTPGINIAAGDGFPSKVYFNGEECAMPTHVPTADAHRSRVNLLPMIFITVMIFVLTTDRLC